MAEEKEQPTVEDVMKSIEHDARESVEERAEWRHDEVRNAFVDVLVEFVEQYSELDRLRREWRKIYERMIDALDGVHVIQHGGVPNAEQKAVLDTLNPEEQTFTKINQRRKEAQQSAEVIEDGPLIRTKRCIELVKEEDFNGWYKWYMRMDILEDEDVDLSDRLAAIVIEKCDEEFRIRKAEKAQYQEPTG